MREAKTDLGFQMADKRNSLLNRTTACREAQKQKPKALTRNWHRARACAHAQRSSLSAAPGLRHCCAGSLRASSRCGRLTAGGARGRVRRPGSDLRRGRAQGVGVAARDRGWRSVSPEPCRAQARVGTSAPRFPARPRRGESPAAHEVETVLLITLEKRFFFDGRALLESAWNFSRTKIAVYSVWWC